MVSSIVLAASRYQALTASMLADAVKAILGLIVLGGGPIQLQERDIGSLCEREPLAGDLDGADDELVIGIGGGLEGVKRGVPGGVGVEHGGGA